MRVLAKVTLAATLSSLLSVPAFAEGEQQAVDVGAMPIVIMIGMVLIAGGVSIWLLRSARRNKQRAQASLGWPQVSGKVIESRLTQRMVSTGEGAETTHYRPNIRYAYEVSGKPYQGDTVRFGNVETTFTNKAQAYLDKYPTGATVSVRYDPADPKVATLETEAATGGLFALGIVFAVLTVACIGMLCYFLWLG